MTRIQILLQRAGKTFGVAAGLLGDDAPEDAASRVAGGAAAIVTKNTRHFGSAELHFPGLRILRPEDLLREIKTWER